MLVSLLEEQYLSGSRGRNSIKFKRVKSGRVAGRRTPSSRSVRVDQSSGSVFVRALDLRVSQRFVCGRGFYGNQNIRQDCVMVETTPDSSAQAGETCIWFAKLLALFRISGTGEGSEFKNETEVAFIQYFDVKEPVDDIDKALGCIRLMWSREQGELGETVSSPWFDLVGIGSLRGVVHIIRGHYGLEHLTEYKRYGVRYRGTSASSTLTGSTWIQRR